MKVMRFGNTEFDSDTHPDKKEAVTIYETASFYLFICQNIAFIISRIYVYKDVFFGRDKPLAE